MLPNITDFILLSAYFSFNLNKRKYICNVNHSKNTTIKLLHAKERTKTTNNVDHNVSFFWKNYKVCQQEISGYLLVNALLS